MMDILKFFVVKMIVTKINLENKENDMNSNYLRH